MCRALVRTVVVFRDNCYTIHSTVRNGRLVHHKDIDETLKSAKDTNVWFWGLPAAQGLRSCPPEGMTMSIGNVPPSYPGQRRDSRTHPLTFFQKKENVLRRGARTPAPPEFQWLFTGNGIVLRRWLSNEDRGFAPSPSLT